MSKTLKMFKTEEKLNVQLCMPLHIRNVFNYCKYLSNILDDFLSSTRIKMTLIHSF